MGDHLAVMIEGFSSKKKIELTTTPTTFPKWTSPTVFVPCEEDSSFSYKYAIVRADGHTEWEPGPYRRVSGWPDSWLGIRVMDKRWNDFAPADLKPTSKKNLFSESSPVNVNREQQTPSPDHQKQQTPLLATKKEQRPSSPVKNQEHRPPSPVPPVASAPNALPKPERDVDSTAAASRDQDFVVDTPSVPIRPVFYEKNEYVVHQPQPVVPSRKPMEVASSSLQPHQQQQTNSSSPIDTTFTEKAQFHISSGPGTRVNVISFHPFQPRLLVAHHQGADVFDFGPRTPASVLLVQKIVSSSPVTVAAYHPTHPAAMFVLGTEAGELRFSSHDNKEPWSLQFSEKHSSISAAAFHQSQPWIACSSRRGSTVGSFTLLNWTSRKALFSYAGHAGPILSLAFHPTRALLASASEDRTVRVWRFDQFAAKQGALPPVREASLKGPTPQQSTLVPPQPLTVNDMQIASVLSAADGDGHVGPVTWVGFCAAEPRGLFSASLDCSLRATLLDRDYDVDVLLKHRMNMRPVNFVSAAVLHGLTVGSGALLIYADDDYVCALDTSLDSKSVDEPGRDSGAGGGGRTDDDPALLLAATVGRNPAEDADDGGFQIDDWGDSDSSSSDTENGGNNAGGDGDEGKSTFVLNRLKLGAALAGQQALTALGSHPQQPLFAVGSADGNVVVYQARPSLAHIALCKRACKFNASAGVWLARCAPEFHTSRAFDLLDDYTRYRSNDVGRNFTVSWPAHDAEFKAVSRVSGADVRLRVGDVKTGSKRFRVLRARFAPGHSAEVRELLTFFAINVLSTEHILVGNNSSRSTRTRPRPHPSNNSSCLLQ